MRTTTLMISTMLLLSIGLALAPSASAGSCRVQHGPDIFGTAAETTSDCILYAAEVYYTVYEAAEDIVTCVLEC